MEYPLLETKKEHDIINSFIDGLSSHIKKAKSRFNIIKSNLGRQTGMIVPQARNWFVPFNREITTFGILKNHHYRKVLLTALRLRCRPEDILALWQNEGLPAWYKDEDETLGRFYPLKNFYMHEPRDEIQARAWAISCILWQRWGLDKLTAHSGHKNDNEPRASSANEHMKAFEDGFKAECAPYLKESPYHYLFDPNGAIELTNKSGLWLFRTRPQYQTTMLALQISRFKSQLKRIPAYYKDFDVPVYTRTVFPAALYMHFNSIFAENHFYRIVKMMVASEKKNISKKFEYNGDDIWRFYTTCKIPPDIIKQVPRRDGNRIVYNGHSWVNALRYELIHQVYEELFSDFEIEELPSIFLIDE